MSASWDRDELAGIAQSDDLHIAPFGEDGQTLGTARGSGPFGSITTCTFPFSDIETICPRPLLFIAGENAHSIEFSEEAYRLAAEPKELLMVPGAGHVDLYDRVDLIPFDHISAFFREHLK